MQYIEVTFTVNPLSETANDIIAALAADLGFESFVESPEGTIGYVPGRRFWRCWSRGCSLVPILPAIAWHRVLCPDRFS